MIGTRRPPARRLVDLTRLERAVARRRRRRGITLAVIVLVLAASGVAALVVDRGATPAPTPAAVPDAEITLLLVTGGAEPFVALVGVGEGRDPAAVVIPSTTVAVVPGHGEGTIAEAAGLEPQDMRIAVSNLVGAWAEHHAVLGLPRLARVVDRAGGVDVELARGPTSLRGPAVRTLLRRERGDPVARWEAVLVGVLRAGFPVRPGDLAAADDPARAADLLGLASGGAVAMFPTEAGAAHLLRPDVDAADEVVVAMFGTPRPVPVVVLDGSGDPGAAAVVAERLLPAGFRIVVSGEASTVAEVTAIGASTRAELAAAQEVRSLLGAGEVSVSRVPSGLGDVTIVIGEDLANG